jgi:hypothetical protein
VTHIRSLSYVTRIVVLVKNVSMMQRSMEEEMGQTRQVIERLVIRFPDHASEIRHSALSDPTFRDICDDLGIALETLSRFEARSDAAKCPEIPEYKALILELEAEISDQLAKIRG